MARDSGNESKARGAEDGNLVFNDNASAITLYGERGRNLKLIEDQLQVTINSKGNELHITGDPISVDLAKRVCLQLYELIRSGYILHEDDVDNAIQILTEDATARLKEIFLDKLLIKSEKRSIAPKTLTQKLYVEAIRKHDIVFGIGPAGTGKTYLALAMAVSPFLNEQVGRIVLTRPAVEAGERLGFLPGDLAEKVNPYLRPLYDALYDMLPYEKVSALLQGGVIEVAPLAFMRGRTLNNAFVILDEAQNTTSEQMKMFLTRLGFDSKAVITGDITQIDLPENKGSGLVEALEILAGIKGISFIRFSKKDVVRHRLVREIIAAYDRREQKGE